MKQYILIQCDYEDWYDPHIFKNIDAVGVLDYLDLYENLEYHKDYENGKAVIEDIDEVFQDYLDLYEYYKDSDGDIVYQCLSIDDDRHVKRSWPEFTKDLLIEYLKTK